MSERLSEADIKDIAADLDNPRLADALFYVNRGKALLSEVEALKAERDEAKAESARLRTQNHESASEWQRRYSALEREMLPHRLEGDERERVRQWITTRTGRTNVSWTEMVAISEAFRIVEKESAKVSGAAVQLEYERSRAEKAEAEREQLRKELDALRVPSTECGYLIQREVRCNEPAGHGSLGPLAAHCWRADRTREEA